MQLLRTLLLGLACAAPVLALAQWQWIDKDGRKVFSDQSPPPDVPAKNILKQPGGRTAPVATPAAGSAGTPAPGASAAAAPLAAASGPKISGKDKELEEKKKLAEAAEASKKKAEEERLAKLRADNCARAKQSKMAFDSGQRITRMNAKGEREFIDDTARAAESKRLDEVIASDCKTT